ncbi:Short-chain dehydrogenase [Pseudomonas sp. 9AZ]|uniref:SDR family NAD(P)-dependent oxidoreductase n=1 Tax=Pseudomonas sp. 9AZ TaxID=2653168 RepID=UPI0012F0E108|nr:SDR family oxidoreductase [Pseudomonas sp. 9AZ]VXD04183.1 Short-chain dehydrogenase [Pseudomonas sp. 9AZ]
MAFRGKVVLITGGGSGMGRAMALRLAAAGAKVAIADLNEAGMAEVVAQHPSIVAFKCNVSVADEVERLVEQVEHTLGPIDRLAAAAGIMPGATIEDMSAERINQIMRVNYEGTVYAVKAVLPGMRARNSGDIILFGSLAGVVFTKGMAAYNASKAAVNAFGEVLAHELRGTGLRITTVRPGAVNTPLIGQASDAVKSLRDAAEKGQMAAPEAIIDAIEAGLGRGNLWIYPTVDACFIQWLRRFSPALAWSLMNYFAA